MITCYFGVPGCGKTTILTKRAQKELKKFVKVNQVISTFSLTLNVKAVKLFLLLTFRTDVLKTV